MRSDPGRDAQYAPSPPSNTTHSSQRPPAAERAGNLTPMTEPGALKRPVLFISHATTDGPIVAVVREEVRRIFANGVEVFASSVPGTIKPGRDWLESIRTSLDDATAVAVLITPVSVNRPWIWFEVGASWSKMVANQRRIYPLCVPEVDKAQLPEPLGRLQALSLGKAAETRPTGTPRGRGRQTPYVLPVRLRALNRAGSTHPLSPCRRRTPPAARHRRGRVDLCGSGVGARTRTGVREYGAASSRQKGVIPLSASPPRLPRWTRPLSIARAEGAHRPDPNPHLSQTVRPRAHHARAPVAEPCGAGRSVVPQLTRGRRRRPAGPATSVRRQPGFRLPRETRSP